MTSRNNIVMREHHYRAANPSTIMMEDRERRWSGRLRLNPKAPLVTPSRLHNHPVDEELRLLKKRLHYGRMSNSVSLAEREGGTGWGRGAAGIMLVGRSVGPWERVMIVISKLICIFTAHPSQARSERPFGFGIPCRREGDHAARRAMPCNHPPRFERNHSLSEVAKHSFSHMPCLHRSQEYFPPPCRNGVGLFSPPSLARSLSLSDGRSPISIGVGD